MPEENILNMPLNNHIYDCITTDQSYDLAQITIPEYTEDDFIRDMETI